MTPADRAVADPSGAEHSGGGPANGARHSDGGPASDAGYSGGPASGAGRSGAVLRPGVVVHPSAEVLAASVAARLAVALLDAQAERGTAAVVLTGGTIAAAVYRSLRDSPMLDAVDWSAVDVWWGDERFLPSGHPERNETQAREALLDALPLNPARVFPMPSSDGPDGDDAEAAAARYASLLAAAGGRGFDVLLLGVGEDGHVASVFPGHPVVGETLPVAAVHGSPKPPPTRITLTLPMLNTAREIWLIASGDGKAAAVARALSPTIPLAVSAARDDPGQHVAVVPRDDPGQYAASATHDASEPHGVPEPHGAPELHDASEPRNSPKPRLDSGSGGNSDLLTVPAARVQGRERTRWLLDSAAARAVRLD